MNLPEDLLEQAEHLLARDATRPKQVNLRRAVSDAYYALFHFLIREACARLVAGRDLRNLTARAFNHGDMKKACQAFRSPTPAKYLAPLVGSVPADLGQITELFVKLQEERHDADYNLARRFTRTEVGRVVSQVRDAFGAWDRVKASPAAAVFLVALLVGDRWNR